MGSALTYGRRYTLALVGLVTDEDDDAEAAQGRAEPTKRDFSPRPDGYAPSASHKVDEAVDAMRAYINVGDVKGIYEEHLRLNKQEALYIAVGDRLDTKEKAALRAAVASKGVAPKAAF